MEPPPSTSTNNRKKKRRWFLAFSGNSLLISILLHVLFAVGATYFIVEHFQKKHINFRATAPPGEHTDVEHKIEMAKRNSVASAPPDLKRIVTTAVSSITLPDLPEVPQDDEVMPTAMSGVGSGMGNGFGNGQGNGNGAGTGSGDGFGDPNPVMEQLSKLLFLLPSDDTGHCPLIDEHHLTIHIPDDDGRTHICTLRVRGLIEQATYDGGTMLREFLNKGGTPDTLGWDVYQLKVDDPPQVYNLNAGKSRIEQVFVIDYTMHIEVKDGSRLTLYADSIDNLEQPNPNKVLVPDTIPDHPLGVKQPYSGQFIQVDAISIDQQ
jgi:hypothetical protein